MTEFYKSGCKVFHKTQHIDVVRVQVYISRVIDYVYYRISKDIYWRDSQIWRLSHNQNVTFQCLSNRKTETQHHNKYLVFGNNTFDKLVDIFHLHDVRSNRLTLFVMSPWFNRADRMTLTSVIGCTNASFLGGKTTSLFVSSVCDTTSTNGTILTSGPTRDQRRLRDSYHWVMPFL